MHMLSYCSHYGSMAGLEPAIARALFEHGSITACNGRKVSFVGKEKVAAAARSILALAGESRANKQVLCAIDRLAPPPYTVDHIATLQCSFGLAQVSPCVRSYLDSAVCKRLERAKQEVPEVAPLQEPSRDTAQAGFRST